MAKITPNQPVLTYTVELTHAELVHITVVLGDQTGDNCTRMGLLSNLNSALYREFDDAGSED